MNIFCDSGGVVFHVDPERIFQGSVGANVVRFIGQFPSSAQVLMSYTLPNGITTTPKLLAHVSELQEVQASNGGKFSVWEGRIGASLKCENGTPVFDENGNIVYDLDYTITEHYGTATLQFFVYGSTQSITVNGIITPINAGILATASVNFTIEKGNPYIPIEFITDDSKVLLNQILAVLSGTETAYENVDKEIKDLQNTDISHEEQLAEHGEQLAEHGEQLAEHGETITRNASNIESLQYNLTDFQTGTDRSIAQINEVIPTLGAKLELVYDHTTHVIQIVLFNNNGQAISVGEFDLPLESVVVGGVYDDSTKSVVLTLQSGETASFPIADLVDGLISTSEKGAANGVATLDENGKVPYDQLPDDIGGGGGSESGVNEEYVDAKVASAIDEAKTYADEKIAAFKLIEIVSELPTEGTENRLYLVAKAEGEEGDLFDAYIWINKGLEDAPSWAWEFEGTKKVEINLATGSTAGVIIGDGTYGARVISGQEGKLAGIPKTVEQYASLHASYFIAKGTLENIKNVYVKEGITANTETLTDEEKASAKTWLGIVEAIASAPYTGTGYSGIPGLFQFDGNAQGGIFKSTVGGDGADRFRIAKASYSEIYNRRPSDYHDGGVAGPNHCKPIVPATADYLVKEVLTDCRIEWTDEEKASAKAWLGIDLTLVDALLEITIDDGTVACITKIPEFQVQNPFSYVGATSEDGTYVVIGYSEAMGCYIVYDTQNNTTIVGVGSV